MKVLKKLYDKSKIIFAVTWIVAYCVLLSVGDSLSELVGIQKSVTLAVGALLSFILFLFISKNGLLREYGLCKSETSPKVMLFYCPVIVMKRMKCWTWGLWKILKRSFPGCRRNGAP